MSVFNIIIVDNDTPNGTAKQVSIKPNSVNFKAEIPIVEEIRFPPITFFANLPFIWGPIGSGGPLPKWAINSSLYSFMWQFVTQILPLCQIPAIL